MQPVLNAQASIEPSQKDISRQLDNTLQGLTSVPNKIEASKLLPRLPTIEWIGWWLISFLPLLTTPPLSKQPSRYTKWTWKSTAKMDACYIECRGCRQKERRHASSLYFACQRRPRGPQSHGDSCECMSGWKRGLFNLIHQPCRAKPLASKHKESQQK